MPDQIYIGNFAKGLTTNPLPFNIDNDAFPTMVNFYSWRGRAKRKRGSLLLGQLEIQVQSVANATPPLPWQVGTIMTLDGSGDGSVNLITLYSLGSTVSIAPGSFTLSDGTNIYTEPVTPNGTLVGIPGGSGTINYATGAIAVTGGAAGGTVVGTFSYYPGLPVLGLRDFVAATNTSEFPALLAFDQNYSYEINQSGASVFFYNVSFYKATNNPVIWSGTDAQQFWTTNYQSALWASNDKPGFHFVNGTYTSGSGTTTITFNFKSGGVNFTNLVIGDKLWFNEWTSGGSNINGITGTVSTVSGAGNYIVTFSNSQIASGTGIAQLLTCGIPGQDGIKWYDGDPTSGTGLPIGNGLGWVNFAPPLTAATINIDTITPALYYLVGALLIVPFKDRLLFFNPFIQTSSGNPIQLQDTVIWSWNGTPYYASATPSGESFDVTAYYVDQTGKGGYLSAGISKPITTVMNNEDVLLVGFGGTGKKTRFVYTGNDLFPFLFFSINSELPSNSTFSAVTLDRGGIDIGTFGIVLTTQQSAQRIDLPIPDSVFQIQNANSGQLRVNAIRDYYREWIYFSYPVNNSPWKFPTQTFLYNYRDDTWAILYENFTAHGNYRKATYYTWATLPFKTWAQWREPWNAGSTSALFPNIVAGNPQGFVLIEGQGTGEGASGTIVSLSNNGGNTQIQSFNHCVSSSNPLTEMGDYIYVQGCLGTTAINGQIGKVIMVIDANNFVVDIPFPAGSYLGLGTYARLSQPILQTKQFPFYWQQGRQLRLGAQKYLLDYTADSQITLNIYLSQDPDLPYNFGDIVPFGDPDNNSLIYSQILYTCPESSNIGLTPANTNLQMPTAQGQYQIWHRMNTSLIGDSVQVGFTLSDTQMRNLTYATSEIALHGIVLNISPAGQLA